MQHWPTVVFSSVVRSTHQGDSHGGVYLLDLETEDCRLVIDWNDPNISWEGRGGDRGLRGIAFWEDEIYLAASDEIFVYDRHFELKRSIRNQYLKHCHEIAIGDDRLFLSGVGYDSILEYDLKDRTFTRAFHLRYTPIMRKVARRRGSFTLRVTPPLSVFDPERDGGPGPLDSTHISFPYYENGLFICGVGLGYIYRLVEGDSEDLTGNRTSASRLQRYGKVPFETHNARPFRGGILANHSPTHRVIYTDRKGKLIHDWPCPKYDPSDLAYAGIAKDHAYQGFCRGIDIIDENTFISGSSPATINVHQFDPPRTIKTINITNDIRNAVHGLRVWPFED